MLKGITSIEIPEDGRKDIGHHPEAPDEADGLRLLLLKFFQLECNL